MTPTNPYLRPVVAAAAASQQQQEKDGSQSTMGPQSQRRLTLNERTHQLQSQSHYKKQKTGQQTLFGDRAFDPLKDCEVCKGKQQGRNVHRAHHKLCYNKRGGTAAARSAAAMASLQEEKRLQEFFSTPLTEQEKCSGKYLTKEAVNGYFAPKKAAAGKSSAAATTATTPTKITSSPSITGISPDDLHSSVNQLLQDPKHVEKHATSRVPLAMLAFAKVVMNKIVNPSGINTHEYFNGITITVPATKDTLMGPQYHSIVGQKLLLVDWNRMYGIDIKCPRCKRGILEQDRSNFSKNKILFPIFVIDGPPLWCMVKPMECPCCFSKLASNCGEVLCQLPAYARNAYPVDTKYALEKKNSHLGKTATNMFDLLMPTYGNGDLCSRLLYHAINRSYAERVEDYYSYRSMHRKENEEPPSYVEHCGGYLTAFPPLGDTIRDTYDAACSCSHTPYGISDHDRHVREIQSISCQSSIAQDHTHEVCKNYFQKKRLGANALWDVATETGEIASAVLVPSTKTIHFAHAAMALKRRKSFSPGIMYSDTWPHKSNFWDAISNMSLQGRLGLFHYIQRVTRTLKKKHIDHFQAIKALLNCIYTYNNEDHESLLKALKEGSLGGTEHTDQDILDLKGTKVFRQ